MKIMTQDDTHRPIDFASAVIEYYMGHIMWDDDQLIALTKLKSVAEHLDVYVRNTESELSIIGRIEPHD